ncbi:FMN-binding protein [Streptomyces sp. GMY02]|uniref:FMN-binding protein n=1 Tax=Streptomyces sp. GMY02 TaxID=1333528 RepID=UPI001C2C7C2B|nr:FMN-binding protein [Streptomyces sp. GMY02]QXE33687.1 FMN-binding protein [Streptomyces sp. GMY02]
MRRAVLATASTSTLVVVLLALKPHHTTALADRAPVSVPVPAPSGTVPSGPGPAASPAAGTGTYTGDPVDTQYGTVQVSITVGAGRLTGVKVLQAPSGDGHSRRVTADAVPRLTQEALSAGSAHIDAVSGASYTSQGYVRSLQSALDRAGG